MALDETPPVTPLCNWQAGEDGLARRSWRKLHPWMFLVHLEAASGSLPAFTRRAAGERRCPGPFVVCVVALSFHPLQKEECALPLTSSPLCATPASPTTCCHRQPLVINSHTVFIHQSHSRDQRFPSPSPSSRARRPSQLSCKRKQPSVVVTGSGFGAGFWCQIPASAPIVMLSLLAFPSISRQLAD